MVIRKILYLILVIVLLFFMVLYVSYLPLMLLTIALALPVVLFIMLIIIKKNISIEANTQNITGNKNQQIPFEIVVSNNSFLPVSNLELSLSYYNNLNKTLEKNKILASVDAFSIQKVNCNILSKHCGNITIHVNKIKIYDYIKLLSIKKKINISFEASVLPNIYDLEIQQNDVDDETLADSQSFSKVKIGDDTSEIFDIREYVKGDNLKRIHWNLSSKLQELMIKDYSLELNLYQIIFLELYSEEKSVDNLECLVELTISLSKGLLDNRFYHYIAWYSGCNDEFHKVIITSEEELYIAINLILDSMNYNDRTYTIEFENSLNDDKQYLHIFYVTSKLFDENILELNKLNSKKTVLYLNDNVEYVSDLDLSCAEVVPIKFASIKQSLGKIVI